MESLSFLDIGREGSVLRRAKCSCYVLNLLLCTQKYLPRRSTIMLCTVAEIDSVYAGKLR